MNLGIRLLVAPTVLDYFFGFGNFLGKGTKRIPNMSSLSSRNNAGMPPSEMVDSMLDEEQQNFALQHQAFQMPRSFKPEVLFQTICKRKFLPGLAIAGVALACSIFEAFGTRHVRKIGEKLSVTKFFGRSRGPKANVYSRRPP
jgi:hypothetical protein